MSGRIKTFNFDDATNQQHLATQDYTICIRPLDGYCCIEYTLCSDSNAWTLDSDADIANTADTDAQCIADDHLIIDGYSGNCTPDTNVVLHTRICGVSWNADTINANVNTKICGE